MALDFYDCLGGLFKKKLSDRVASTNKLLLQLLG